MIKIENVKTEYENSALWITITVNTNNEINDYCYYKLTISSTNKYISDFKEKLIKGKNETEIMLYVQDAPWFPNGCGDTFYSELNLEVFYGKDSDKYRKFIHFGNYEYKNNIFRVYNYYPMIFGLSLQHASIHQLEIAANNGINSIFTNDRREEIIDFCIIKGLCLLPFDTPNCKKENIELFRKKNKTIILSYSDIDPNFILKQTLSPVYIGKDFISNNTNNYISGILSQGYLNPLTGNIRLISEKEISVNEFNNFSFSQTEKPKENELAFTNLWYQKNIIAKNIEYGKNIKFTDANIIITKFQINENIWEVLFSSNEFIPNIFIDTEDNINKNNFSIFPGETVSVIFRNIKDTPVFSLKR